MHRKKEPPEGSPTSVLNISTWFPQKSHPGASSLAKSSILSTPPKIRSIPCLTSSGFRLCSLRMACTTQETLLSMAADMTRRTALPCTACRYCTTHCPKGLDIPRLLELYNEHVFTGGGFIAPMALMAVPDRKQSEPVDVQVDDMVEGVHEHLELGTGTVDFPAALAALVEVGYRGLCSLELPRQSHAAPLVAGRSLTFLRRALDRRPEVVHP